MQSLMACWSGAFALIAAAEDSPRSSTAFESPCEMLARRMLGPTRVGSFLTSSRKGSVST